MKKILSHKLFPYATISFVILLVYAKTLVFGFTWLEDNLIIIKQYGFIKNIENVPLVFAQDAFISNGNVSTFYRPINTLSYMVDAQICGKEAYCYHFSNVLYHTLCVLLLYF